MRKYIASLLLCVTLVAFSQEVKQDTVAIEKSTAIDTKREFPNDINQKYSGKDFEYKDNEVPKKETEKQVDLSIVKAVILFFAQVFPWLLGAFVLYLILKVVFDLDINLFKKNPKTSKVTEKLVYEDDDIHEVNLDELLANALQNGDYRLAIRYYYLLILKGLSTNKLIDYHKDKTNSEYLSELKNEAVKQQFSTLSYIYAYVWYGEFSIDETTFKRAEKKYQSFLTQFS